MCENSEDHKFLKTKIWVTETWNEVDENGDERKCGEEDDERRNGKQQCDVSLLAESMVKQRENTEETGTASSLHHTCQMCDHPARVHLDCLGVYVIKKAAKETTKAVSMVQSWNKKIVPPNLWAIRAKWVTITLKDFQIIPQYLQWKAARKKMRTVSMVQSWNRTISVVHFIKQYTWCRAETEQYPWCRT